MKPFPSPAQLVATCGMGFLLLLGLGLFPVDLGAQVPSAREMELERELEKARREIEALKAEIRGLRGETAVPPTPRPVVVEQVPGASASASQGLVVPKTSGPVESGLPTPVPEGGRVEVATLLADYRASGWGGDAKYRGRRFEIAGTVRSFKKVFASMTWEVELEAGGALGLVRCRVTFPGISDFRGEESPILEGRKPFRAWESLISRGGPVVLAGRCDGMDGAVIQFRECRLAR